MSSRRSRNGGIAIGKTLSRIVEIAPEALVGNHRRQIQVRGGDQAHSHPNLLRAPEQVERLLLQDPQEFGLEIQWNVADLVEKERATVRELESADAAGQHNGKP
jgi:hypothetical protein